MGAAERLAIGLMVGGVRMQQKELPYHVRRRVPEMWHAEPRAATASDAS